MTTLETIGKLITDNSPLSYAIIIAFVVVMSAWALVSLNGATGTSDTDIKKEPVEEEEDDYPANEDDHIICTVPGQPMIQLKPNEFSEYSEEFEGVWTVTLRNGHSIYLPMQYTTIVDKTYFLTK